MTWSNNNLTGMSKTGMNISYTYNAEGLRTSKTVNGVTTTYYYENGNLIRQKNSSNDIWFMYDGYGELIGFTNNGTSYYYGKNVLGDIIYIINQYGNTIVNYVYDAWGNTVATYGGEINTIGKLNPFIYKLRTPKTKQII